MYDLIIVTTKKRNKSDMISSSISVILWYNSLLPPDEKTASIFHHTNSQSIPLDDISIKLFIPILLREYMQTRCGFIGFQTSLNWLYWQFVYCDHIVDISG
jgi:hypothetical protein